MYKGTSGREQESIIGFYNKVYMVAMKSTILQFAPNKVSEPFFFFIVNGSLYTNQAALSWCPQHEVTRSVPFSHCWLLCPPPPPPPPPSIFSVFPGRHLWELSVSPLNSTHWFGQASNADLSIWSPHSFIILLIMGCTLPFARSNRCDIWWIPCPKNTRGFYSNIVL